MIYVLVLIIWTTPQTIVTIGHYGTLDACMKRATGIVFSKDIGKTVCIAGGEGWSK